MARRGRHLRSHIMSSARSVEAQSPSNHVLRKFAEQAILRKGMGFQSGQGFVDTHSDLGRGHPDCLVDNVLGRHYGLELSGQLVGGRFGLHR